MGIGGISIWQLLIVLAIVVMLFGTKRLRNLGSDLGEAIKGFRNSIGDKQEDSEPFDKKNEKVIDGEAEEIKNNNSK